MHFKLYEGYVKETNQLTEKLAAFLEDGKVDQEEMPAYSELNRSLGFEYKGWYCTNTTLITLQGST
jgi:Fe-Mn family superoxide dismutase